MILIQIIIGLVPTFLLSRLLLWLTKAWQGGYLRYLVVHVISGVLAVVLAAFANADGGPLMWGAGLPYVISQAILLAVDLFAYRGRIAGKSAERK